MFPETETVMLLFTHTGLELFNLPQKVPDDFTYFCICLNKFIK